MKLNLPKTLLNKLKSKKNLEAQLLNLSDAFELASILKSKIDLDKISPQTDAVDFISDIIEKLSPEEYLRCVMLLTKENKDTIQNRVSIEILAVFIEGLRKNQVVSLLDFYKNLGL